MNRDQPSAAREAFAKFRVACGHGGGAKDPGEAARLLGVVLRELGKDWRDLEAVADKMTVAKWREGKSAPHGLSVMGLEAFLLLRTVEGSELVEPLLSARYRAVIQVVAEEWNAGWEINDTELAELLRTAELRSWWNPLGVEIARLYVQDFKKYRAFLAQEKEGA